MKLSFKLSAALLASALIFSLSSCKKDSNDDAKTNSSSGTMTATVDGVSWSALPNRAAGAIVAGNCNVTGTAADSSSITITITEPVLANVPYDLSAIGDGAGAYMSSKSTTIPSWTSNASGTTSGTFLITTLDTVNKKMTGTFSFTAYRATDNTTKTITNGVFTNVTYVTSVHSTGNNSFSVTIDGTPFTPSIIAGVLYNGNVTITASDSQGAKSVGLGVSSTIAPGTYAIGSLGDPVTGQYNVDASTYTLSDGTGSLIITANNSSTKTISGTFNFNSVPFTSSTPVYHLTNGNFTVIYQ